MIERIRTAYANGKSVLWLSQMSGLSTDEVMRIVKDAGSVVVGIADATHKDLNR